MSVSGRVGQLHYWQQYLCTMWQCDMGILQFNSIHSRHASLNIRMLNDISENPSKYICNICYRLFLYVFIKAMLPEIDIMLTRLSNYVVFAARADLQHVYLRSCLLFFGWLYQDAAFFGIYQTKSTWEPKRVRFEKGTYHQLFRYLKCENQPATAQPTTMHNLICFCWKSMNIYISIYIYI